MGNDFRWDVRDSLQHAPFSQETAVRRIKISTHLFFIV